MPTPPEASAVHHITTAMVAGKAPILDRTRTTLEALADPGVPFVAHNAAFNSAFLKPAVPAWTAMAFNLLWGECRFFRWNCN